MSAGQPDEDEITWGSDELPIENLNPNMTDGRSDIWNLLPQMQFFHIFLCFWGVSVCNSALTIVLFSVLLLDGPIITEEELTSLPLVKVVPDGQYTGTKLNTVVRMMRGLLEQKVPLQEFDVRNPFEFFIVWEFFDLYWVFKNICFSFSQNLQNLEPLDDCLIAQTKENRKKNRYKNVVPCKKNTYFLVYSPVLCIISGDFLKY